jgi:hypothetical protein
MWWIIGAVVAVVLIAVVVYALSEIDNVRD